ncbi:uncharacterized protein LOC132202295 [Neocloeon triangulifer]|uniref:uncharacterized protein LOC132202295 n=1 Tax=Neocloeon triangulifer TaxID=2078957 RepID=UPI00286EDE0B|nr:uncharacterized protein LOC132202295 [Neocloeon triangulifer]
MQISMEKEFNKPFVSSVGKDESSRLWIQAEKVSEGKIKMKILMRSAEKAWTAELTDATASKYYTQYSLSAKDYWNAILSELLSPSENFSISVRNEEFVVEKLGSNQIRLVYAKVDVEEAPFLQCLLSMTETLLETQTELRKSNKRLEKKIVDVTEDKVILQEQLEKFTEDAVTKEELLLSNFLAVLNAKKEKIQRLQDEIEGKGEDDGSPAENEYDAETDVDEGQDTPPKDQPSSSSRPEKARKTDLRDNFDDVMDL